jgi:hypothetical protein
MRNNDTEDTYDIPRRTYIIPTPTPMPTPLPSTISKLRKHVTLSKLVIVGAFLTGLYILLH